MDLDSTSEFEFKFTPILISLIVILLFNIIALIIHILLRNWKDFVFKKGVSELFLSNNVAINNTFFDTFNKKFNVILITWTSFLSVLITIFVSLIIFLSTKAETFRNTVLFSLFIILGISLCIFPWIDLSKILPVKKEFKIWKAKNQDLQGASLFEDLVVERNDIILRIFSQNYLEKSTTFGMFNVKLRSKFENWRKSILKSKGNVDNEFYYFLIFNYQTVSINSNHFKIQDYAYIYQNRKQLFNLSQNSKQLK
ncbi:MAG0920 family protein [Mycoplasma phocoeninasale]|uniref:MAG0920 family protein n=1 Tax=Mycoplasma phocoeninasale TaxID=2726117 RepID=UPI0019681CE6|nr:hypothetical protein [Mycoplasma phocoeninasale]MBN0970999.1 hypothetical protein [Mycoplasma phocoeninasale]